MDELYADSIGGIALTAGVVRVDLHSLSATERDEKNNPKPVFRQRIIMPVEGFVQSFALMAQVMQQLEKNGVIKKGPPPAEGAAAAAATAPAKPKSPNFK
jgi:hypothetical protein